MMFVLSIPVILLILLFALSNKQPVLVGLWPTDYRVEISLALAVLVIAAAAFVLGAVLVWLSELGQRRRAARAERRVRALEDQIQELRARGLSAAALPPPA